MSLKSNGSQAQRLTIAVLVAVLLAAIIPTKITHAQVSTPASYIFEECDQVEASTLRDELNRITQAIFAEEQGGIDLAAIVNRNWMALSLDATVDKAVEAATERVKNETGLLDRLISGWSPAKAEELTKKVATLAFDSADFRDALDNLSLNIADAIVEETRLITAKSASSALLCVQTFIGDSISPTMASVLEEEIQTRMEELDLDSEEDMDILDIVESHSNLAGGVAVIVGTQIAKTLGKQLAKRIASKVVTRVLSRVGSAVIPLAGWVIGGVLILVDLFQAREGSFPDIRDALQNPDVKEEIKGRVTDHVFHELRTVVPQLARDVSNSVFSRWQEFRKKHSRVLELAEDHERFRNILDSTAVEEVQKLADFATLIEDRFGLERLTELIDEGHFERLLVLPQETLVILHHVEDPQVAIGWADLAGELLLAVIEMELYRVSSPAAFRDRADLERVLALGDAGLVQKLMLVSEDARGAVLGLPSTHITQILDTLSVEELTWLAKDYLAVLDEQMRNVLVDRILRQPVIKADLNAGIVRGALLAGTDFEGTLNYVSQRTGDGPWIGETVNMLAAIGPALSGELPLTLFWYYDGRVLLNVLYVLAGLILLYIVWRRVFTGRRQDVNVNVVLPGNQGSVGSDSDVKRIGTGKDEEESN